MYKFRSTAALLKDYKELEKQEIYFSNLKQLHDPMEDFINFVWKGDQIVWKNLLDHYLLCLLNIIILRDLLPEGYILTKENIKIYESIENFETPEYKNLFIDIEKAFFCDEFIKEYLYFLSRCRKDISDLELQAHLNSIHPVALSYIFEEYKKKRKPFFVTIPKKDTDIKIKVLEEYKRNRKILEKQTCIIKKLYDVLLDISNENLLTLKYANQNNNQRNNFILFDFPYRYVDKIKDFAYPRSYIACFTDKCDIPSLWGFYGDNHKGVCLKFKTKFENNYSIINLFNKKVNIQEKLIVDKFKFEQVKYSNYYPAIDFFTNQGMISLENLNNYWYTGKNGKKSKYSENKISQNQFRKAYLEKYYESMLNKFTGLKSESEYRLIINDFADEYQNPEYRKLKYDFNDLEGIIFGCKTSIDDKLAIIKIIARKCRENNRQKFDFYQAAYIPETGKMDIRNMWFKLN